LRKCWGSERMKILAFWVFIEPDHWFKSGQFTNQVKKLTHIKNEQNPSKSCDFERISRLCAILIGFYLFLGLCYGFESLKQRKSQKPEFWGLSRVFDNNTLISCCDLRKCFLVYSYEFSKVNKSKYLTIFQFKMKMKK